ncbi:MAG: hypothetical protein WCO44_00505 [Bacteroidota bacterium]
MKKWIIFLICWQFYLTAFAQATQVAGSAASAKEMNTVFDKEGGAHAVVLGYFIELNGGYSRFGHENVFLPGISMGLIFNHHWTAGLTGSFIGNPKGLHFHHLYHDSASATWHGANLYGGYGGLLLEYTLFPKSRLHLSFPLILGGGYLYFDQQQHHNGATHTYHDWRQTYLSRDHFFLVEPGVKAECNIIRTLRIGITVSYRYSPDLDLNFAPAGFINQFTARLGLRFGKF